MKVMLCCVVGRVEAEAEDEATITVAIFEDRDRDEVMEDGELECLPGGLLGTSHCVDDLKMFD
jgi:hypothetical protein